MKKCLIVFALCFIFGPFLLARSVGASMVTINNKGEVIINVLSSEDSVIALSIPQGSSLEVNSLMDNNENEELVLKKEDEKVSLKVGNDGLLDVTNTQDNLIDIEERGEVKKVQISLENNRFKIAQDNASALTDYSIRINPRENKISVTTTSGEKYLAILPFDAAQSVLRAKIISRTEGKPFELFEENKDLAYLVEGKREINLFNIATLPIEIKTKVSASTGEIISVEQPTWLKVFGFLFV